MFAPLAPAFFVDKLREHENEIRGSCAPSI